MKIEIVKIEDLVSDPDNARIHDEKNLNAIKGSINQFGIVEPLIVQRGTNLIIGGNGRLEVLKTIGVGEVPVHYVDLDEKKTKALSLALNRAGELAGWDMDILGPQLHALREDDFDLTEIGFDTSYLDGLQVDMDILEEKPEAEQKFNLSVSLKDESEQQDLFNELRERGYRVKL